MLVHATVFSYHPRLFPVHLVIWHKTFYFILFFLIADQTEWVSSAATVSNCW